MRALNLRLARVQDSIAAAYCSFAKDGRNARSAVLSDRAEPTGALRLPSRFPSPGRR